MEELIGIFRTSLLARRLEARIIQLALAGEIPASLHPGAGQEVEQTAVLAALGPDDKVLYAHRGVAYMLARGVAPAQILADIAGREGATNRGKGGVMHVVDVGRGVLGESGTLGGGFVISVGVGMALRRRKKGEVVVHFFGDGGANRGTFHESLNWASVQRLPCIYVCENNGWAVSVPATASTSVADIACRAAGYGIPGVVVDGNNPEAVLKVTREAVDRARSGLGPTLIEAKVSRLLGHYVGDQQGYRRDRDEVGSEDPLQILEARLVEDGSLDPEALNELLQSVDEEIHRAVDTMRAAPPLPPELAVEDVYA